MWGNKFSSVAQSCLTLWPHGLHNTRPPCPSPTLGIYSNSCPSSRWCHPAISSSVVPFSSCPQSLLASGSFPMSQLFTWGGQSTGVSASASVPPMNTQDWPPLGWTGWISLQSKGLSRVLQHHSSKASIFQCSAFFTVQLSHPYMTTGKTIALTRRTFVGNVMSLLFIFFFLFFFFLFFYFFFYLWWILSYIEMKQKYGTLHEFAYHPCAGAMLIFSVSFQFLVYVLPKRARLCFLICCLGWS